MDSIGFKESTADTCVFVHTSSVRTIIAVYVDDLILLTETIEDVQMVKESLEARFKMKDMGELGKSGSSI